MNQATSISSIIKGCKKHDRPSQHGLYKLYYGYAMSISMRYVFNESEAITIVNDSFMKVFDKINLYDDTQAIKPWIRKIIVNTALDYLKASKKLKMEVDINDQYDLSAPESILSKIGYEDLLAMIKNLSQAYRTVFNLYVIDGFKHEEIAQKLNISVGTSKSNLYKARKALQAMVITQLNITHA